MTIPTRAIDRLFERLAATYGAAWARQWDSVPIMDVKSLWAHELSIYGDRLEVLAWALENLPEFVPNEVGEAGHAHPSTVVAFPARKARKT
jgi:hypothetical protein